MMDFDEDREFENCQIIAGHLKEVKCEEVLQDEDDALKSYDICPQCGGLIYFENDARNGFCIACTMESDNI